MGSQALCSPPQKINIFSTTESRQYLKILRVALPPVLNLPFKSFYFEEPTTLFLVILIIAERRGLIVVFLSFVRICIIYQVYSSYKERIRPETSWAILKMLDGVTHKIPQD